MIHVLNNRKGFYEQWGIVHWISWTGDTSVLHGSWTQVICAVADRGIQGAQGRDVFMGWQGCRGNDKNITQGWQRKAGIFIRTGVFRVGSVKQRRRFKHFLDTGIIVICFSVMIILITYVNIYFFSFVNTFLFSMSTYTYFVCQHVLNSHINMNYYIDLISLTWCWLVEF